MNTQYENKCPKCNNYTYVVSVFGSICRNCYYEPPRKSDEDLEKEINEKIV